jgi:hypothetical protein
MTGTSGPGQGILKHSADAPAVSAVVLNWNGFDDTVECIDSLLLQDYPDIRIIIVDNGSGNDEAGRLEEKYRQSICLIRSPANVGFCGGNNLALRRILDENRSRYVFLANNDIVLATSCITSLVNAAESLPDGGFFGGKTFIYGTDLLYCAYGIVQKFKGDAPCVGYRERDTGQYDKHREVPYVNGHAFLVRTKAAAEIGLFDERLFAYYDETDLQMRGHVRGYASYYIPEAVCQHKISRATRDHKNLRSYLGSRNRFLFMRKHFPGHYPFFLIFYLIRFVPRRLMECCYHLMIERDPLPFRYYVLSLRYCWKSLDSAGNDRVLGTLLSESDTPQREKPCPLKRGIILRR